MTGSSGAGSDDHALIRRRDAAQATLDAWQGKRFRLGEFDCARLAASHLRRLGYRVKLPPKRSYRTARSALAVLEKLGFSGGLPDALDALGLERIAPAAAIAGDLLQLPSEDERIGGLTVALGNGRVLGWHEALAGAEVLQPLAYRAAWRVEPR